LFARNNWSASKPYVFKVGVNSAYPNLFGNNGVIGNAVPKKDKKDE